MKLAAEDRTWPGIKKRLLQKDYASIELKLMKEFSKSIRSGYLVEIEGFVTRIGGRRFILRPSLGILDQFVVCEAEGIKLPADYDFIRVTGYKKHLTTKSTIWTNEDIIIVDKVERISLPQDHLRPEISLKDAEDFLMQGYVDAITPIKSNVVLSLISSPKDRFRTGGLTSTLMPVKEPVTSSISIFLNDVKRMIPNDLASGKLEKISTKNSGKIEVIPFSWGIFNISSSKIKTEHQRNLVSRVSSESALNEQTIGVSATSIAPKTLDDVGIKNADFPLLVDEPLERSTSVKGYDSDLAKFLITVHTNQPVVSLENEEKFEKMVKKRLVKLKHEYDSEGYSGLIDLNIDYGSPRSILHISKAFTRASGSEVVSTMYLREAIDEFIESRKYMFEIWEEAGIRYKNPTDEQKLKYLGKVCQRIYQYILNNPFSIKSEIREIFPKLSDTVFENSFKQLKDERLIYLSSEIDEKYSIV